MCKQGGERDEANMSPGNLLGAEQPKMEELRSSRGFCVSYSEEGDDELRPGPVDSKTPIQPGE